MNIDKEIELLKLKIQLLEKEIELEKMKDKPSKTIIGSYPWRTESVPCVKAIPMPPRMHTYTEPHSFSVSNAMGIVERFAS